jgi:hypothetical protein
MANTISKSSGFGGRWYGRLLDYRVTEIILTLTAITGVLVYRYCHHAHQ